jgi:processive 1,2-diacylglycerol beta-glucosyltransferase
MVRHLSPIWGLCFQALDLSAVYALCQPIRRAWNLAMARRFVRWLRDHPPDAIVTTHFFPTDVISACKRHGGLSSRLVVVVTDLYPHRFWLSREAEAFICGTEEGRAHAASRGIPSERLHVCGIPVHPAFSQPFEPLVLRRELGLEPDRLTALVTSGGSTVGPFEAVVEALLQLERTMPRRLQLLVVCGDDPGAVRRLSERAEQSVMPARVFGFIETMADLMAASDVVVAKAGGLTVSEALTRGVPLVLYHVIPGQEQVNAEFVSQGGAAVLARNPRAVAEAVRRLIQDPEQLEAMRKAASRLSRPQAAQTIATDVVAPLLRKSAA